MKILFVISNIANGGAERVIATLCEEFSVLNDECEILYFEKNAGFYDFKASLKHLSLYEKNLGLFGRIFAKFSKFFKIRKAVIESKADVIISLLDQTNINVLISTLFLRQKLIISEHTDQSALKSPFWRMLRRLLYPLSSSLVVLNKTEQKYYNFVKNIHIIYNPLSAQFLEKNPSVSKENIILCAGRLEEVKNYKFFLKCLEKLPEDLTKKWRVEIAGDGSLRQELEKIAAKCPIEVRFLGHISDLKPLYARSKILALPSKSESFGNILVECICFACARIATNTSGAKELIDSGKDGIIANEEDFALALKELLENEEKQKILAQNAFLRLENFKASKIAKDYKNLIEKL